MRSLKAETIALFLYPSQGWLMAEMNKYVEERIKNESVKLCILLYS